jgi:hypothetical protein
MSQSGACASCVDQVCFGAGEDYTLCAQQAQGRGGACYNQCSGAKGPTPMSTKQVPECANKVHKFLHGLGFPDAAAHTHGAATSSCEGYKPKQLASSFFEALGVRSKKYWNPASKTWREEVQTDYDERIDSDYGGNTADNKKRCMANEFNTNPWLEANYKNIADPHNHMDAYTAVINKCTSCPYIGTKDECKCNSDPNKRCKDLTHPHIVPPLPPQPLPLCHEQLGVCPLLPLRMPGAYLFELENPQTNTNPHGEHCYIAVNGKAYCRKPDSGQVPINPPDEWGKLYEEFEAFLAEFNWSVDGFAMFAASIPVAGFAAYKAGRPEMAVVYTGGGAVAPMFYRYAMGEYEKLVLEWEKYHAAIDAAIPLGAAVVAVMGEAALGLPPVIQSYTMLAGVVVAAGTFVYEELKEIF